MGRPRGSKNTLGDALVRGLRLEVPMAQAIRRYAVELAGKHADLAGKPTEPNMAAAARDLLRRGLATLGSQFHGAGSPDDAGYREGYLRGLADVRKRLAEGA